MSCQRCDSERVLSINVKHSDRFSGDLEGTSHHGYAPHIPGICRDDYTDPDICLDCGQVQGDFPADTPEEFVTFTLECEACGAEVETDDPHAIDDEKFVDGKCKWSGHPDMDCDGTYNLKETPR